MCIRDRVFHRHAQIHVALQKVQQFARMLFQLFPVDETAARLIMADEYVFQTAHIGHKLEFLMYDGDLSFLGLANGIALKLHALAVDIKFSRSHAVFADDALGRCV